MTVSATSPLSGWLTDLAAVPDPVFADRMLGDGVAIDPTEGLVRAPFDGRVVTLHPARHAVTLESDAGAMVLIHVGLETVALGGEGFTTFVSEGERVSRGDPLIAFDLDLVGRKAKSLVTPVIVTNGEAFGFDRPAVDRVIGSGEPLLALAPVAAVDSGRASAGTVVERSLLLPLRHGLHARPGARIAECARAFEARVEIVAEDGRVASTLSPVSMLALALPHGAAIELRGRGNDAEQAVAAIADLIGSGMGEGLPVSSAPAPAPAPSDAPLPSMLRGVTASAGSAIGPAWRLVRRRFAIVETGGVPKGERDALHRALDMLRQEKAETEGAVAAIAEAHRAFLADPELIGEAERRIDGGKSAAFAWQRAIERFIGLLDGSGDRRFAERIDDLRDLEDRVLAVLLGQPSRIEAPAGAILVAEELLPSQLMALANSRLAGIATGGGGPTSHVAIIAAGLGLPMVAALGHDVTRIEDGTMLLLDAAAATLSIDPSAEFVERNRAESARRAAFRAEAASRAQEPAITRDGARIELYANLGSLDDAVAAARAGAEGCGLLRTEFLFLDRPSAPDEEEQHRSYQAIADALGARPLIVRTLDIGADKPAPYLPMPAEDNPALGLRGLRLGLARPELMETQLRALARVQGDVRIMLPMVVEPGEVRRVRAMLAATGASIPLGIMVETPAAAMLADVLAADADFFSIGSNDLSQYALAMDRGNPAVASQLDALHPAVLRLVAATVQGGAHHDRWTGVCGGMAADPLAVPILIGLGVTELSVPPALVAETKEHVRRTSLSAARDLALAALAADSAQAVRALAKAFVEGAE